MESIKISLLDLFAYVLPGGVALGVAFCFFQIELDLPRLDGWQLLHFQVPFFTGILLLGLAYVTGFTTGLFGRWILEWIEKRFKQEGKIDERSENYCIARHQSPANFECIHNLVVAKRMTANLGFIALLNVVSLCVLKANICTYLTTIVISVGLAVAFFYAAWDFHKKELKDVESVNKRYPPKESGK